MNPQPDPVVGNIFAAIFVLMIIYYTIKAVKENKVIQLNDTFIIGYVEDTKPVKIQKPKFIYEKLHIDCVDTLVALGMKKKEAKNVTQDIFTNHTNKPTTIQEFLNIALKLPS